MNIEALFDKIQNKKKSTSIIGKIIAGLFVLAGIVVVVWKMSRMGKEQARLMHEKYVKEEEAKQAEENSIIQTHEKDRLAALEEANRLEEEVTDLEIEIYEIEMDKKRVRDTIARISSWDDVDKIVVNSKKD